MAVERSPSLRLTLLLVPSFWGACTWAVAYVAYHLRLLAWYPTSAFADAVFVCAGIFFVLSCILTRPYYDRASWAIIRQNESRSYQALGASPIAFLLVLHLIGLVGVALYVRGLAIALAGWQGFVAALLYAPQYLRWANAESIGTQLSYFGWVGIGLTVWYLRRRELPRAFWTLVVVQLVANLFFVDRTRPTWIGFTAVLVALSVEVRVSRARAIRAVLWSIALFLIAYFGIAALIGKVPTAGAYGRTSLPLLLQPFYVYITAGFAYLNQILAQLSPEDFHSGRVLYPLWMFASRLGFGIAPPSQVNDEYWLPFPVNVGTFLEPWYRDGGVLLLCLGMLVQTVVTDFLALSLLRSQRPLAVFAWANLCFSSFIAFFTPKLVTFPIWLFVALGAGAIAIGALRRSGDAPAGARTTDIAIS